MTTSDLVLVVPCYNEATRLRRPCSSTLSRAIRSVGSLFVDDGSVDGTTAVLERMALESPAGIRAIRLPTNQGKAEAVRRGLLEAMAANPALVGFWDADLSTPLTAVGDFLSVAAKLPERRPDPRLPRSAHGPRHPAARPAGTTWGASSRPPPRWRSTSRSTTRSAGRRSFERTTLCAASCRAPFRSPGSSTWNSSPATSPSRWTTAAGRGRRESTN